MNSPKEIVKEMSKKLVSAMITHDLAGWPPDCMILTYQPIRPICNDTVPQEINLEKE